MVRLSDILKKKFQESGAPKEPESSKQKGEPLQEKTDKPLTPEEASSMRLIKAVGPTQEQKKCLPENVQIAKALEQFGSNIERASSIYKNGVQLARDILKKNPLQQADLELIKNFSEELVNCLVLRDNSLFVLFHEDYPIEDFLYYHAVNAMIMSIEVGLGLGYNKSQLNNLGLAAFLYDIGMEEVKNIVLQQRSLIDKEQIKIKEHPFYSAQKLSQLKDVPEDIVRAIKEHHERSDAKGYPRGLREKDISEFGRIIAVVDIYEALTHNRSHRRRISPHDALKHILDSEIHKLDRRMVKILISKIGVYPIGSWVELNTKEIGKVVNTSEEFPLRPVVSLFFDSSANCLDESRIVNLSEQCNLFVQRPLSDDEVSRLIAKEKN